MLIINLSANTFSTVMYMYTYSHMVCLLNLEIAPVLFLTQITIAVNNLYCHKENNKDSFTMTYKTF